MKKFCMIMVFCFLTTMAMVSLVFAGETMVIYYKNGRTENIDLGSVQRIEFPGGKPKGAAVYPSPSSGGTYQLIAKNSGKCLDVAGVGLQNGANGQQWDCHGGSNQLWTLTDKGGGYFLVTAKHSGKCLDVAGVSTGAGANVYQWDCHSGPNQLWMFIPQGQGYFLVTAKHSGKCLDVAGVGTGAGANIQQWDCHGGEGQLWKLK